MNCLYLEVAFVVAFVVVVAAAIAAAVAEVVAAVVVVVAAAVVVAVADCSHARCPDSLRFQPFFARIILVYSKDTIYYELWHFYM